MPPQRSGHRDFRFGRDHRTSKRPGPGSPFVHFELVRAVQVTPPTVDRPSDNRTEQRTDLRRRQIVTGSARLAARLVEPLTLVVERRPDIFRNRDRPPLGNPSAQPISERHHGYRLRAGQPPASRLTSVKRPTTSPGITPMAMVITAVRVRATPRDIGTETGDRSPSGASSAHMPKPIRA